MNKKKRRHSGWICPQATISKKEIFKNDLFLDIYYDDWKNYRDGQRDWFSDNKKIKKICATRSSRDDVIEKRLRMNAKQKKLLKRRKAKKDLSFAKRIKEAFKRYEKGRFKEMNFKEFSTALENW